MMGGEGFFFSPGEGAFPGRPVLFFPSIFHDVNSGRPVLAEIFFLLTEFEGG